jgi:hypothetical protein
MRVSLNGRFAPTQIGIGFHRALIDRVRDLRLTMSPLSYVAAGRQGQQARCQRAGFADST